MHERVEADAGFTLVELMVVITLLTMVMGIAVGSWRSYAQAREQSGATAELREGLRSAQQRAVTEGRATCMALERTTYQLFRGRCSDTDRDPLMSAQQLPGSVYLEAPTFTEGLNTVTAGVTFFPRGTASPGQVVVRREGKSARDVLKVEGLTGRVTVD